MVGPFFPPEPVQKLWELLQPPTHLAWRPSSQEMLGRFLATAFYAGSLTEEAHRVRGGLAFIDPAFVPMPLIEVVRTVQFQQRLELTPQVVAKLLPSTDPERARIAVFEEQGKLLVWGLVFDGSQMQQFRGLRTDKAERRARLDLLLERPGRVTAEVGPVRLLTFRDGLILERGPAVLDEDGPVRTALSRIEASGFLFGTPFSSSAHVPGWTLPNMIRMLVFNAANHAHGALFLFGASNPPTGLADGGYRIGASQSVLADCLRAAMAAQKRDLGGALHPEEARLPLEGANEAAMDLCEEVARLSAVDGAVVFGNRLELLGYGATVKDLSAQSGLVAADSAASTPSPYDFRERGHRHRAAASAVLGGHASLAMVVSQDGDVSAFAQHQGKPTVWRNVELSLVLPPVFLHRVEDVGA